MPMHTEDFSQLENEIKQLIIISLELEDINIDDIDSNAPLFVEGLGLDSIDALELGMALKKKYKVTLNKDEDSRKHFYSVKTLAEFVANQIKS
jgi:acyl carrier protein